MPKVSVIIPVYNVEHYLPKCLDSVINQTYKDMEIICVNDCSLDDSLKICKEYATKDSRIKIINREKNGGLSAARNSGLDNASGEYIYFIDSDDYIDLDYIEKMVEMIEKHSVDMVLNTNILAECGGKSEPFVSILYKKKLPKGEFLPKEVAINNSLCTVWAHLYKKDFLDKYKLRFPEGYIHEDEYFQHTSKIHLNSLFTFYGPAYHYLQRQGSIISSRKSKIEGYVKIFTLIYKFYKNNNLLHKDIAIKCFKINHFDTIKNEQEFALTKDYIELISKDFEKCHKASSHAEKYIFRAIKESNSFDDYRAKTGKNAFLTYMTREKMKQKNKGYKLSVIIPVYNTEKYLRKCLDSVCNQTLQDIEIICVNDTSTDNSLAILQEYAQTDHRIRIINFSQNKGAAVARNTAIDEAKGEYIGFVDSDDYIDLDFYEKLYERAKKDNAELVVARLQMENEYGVKQDIDFVDYFFMQVKKNKLSFYIFYTSGLYNANLLDRYSVRFSDGLVYGEDRLFPLQSSYYTNKLVLVDNTTYHYVRNGDSITINKKDEKIIKSFITYNKAVLEFLNSVELSRDDYSIVVMRYIDDYLFFILQVTEQNLRERLCVGFKSDVFPLVILDRLNDSALCTEIREVLDANDLEICIKLIKKYAYKSTLKILRQNITKKDQNA